MKYADVDTTELYDSMFSSQIVLLLSMMMKVCVRLSNRRSGSRKVDFGEREREGFGLSFQKTESRDSIRCNAKLCVSACLCVCVRKAKLFPTGATCRGHPYCESSRRLMMKDDDSGNHRH